ncbi:MAG: cytochrome c biogenesis protein ResB [Candidatus Marinimicrobia bacterium]|nr:cytochrome c biogenesis protein ResB [Candidatus Neomarinimicrobiota bacterium]
MKQFIKIVSNPKIFVYTIIWLMVLVVVGTLAQRDIGLYASQQKYFSANITWLGDIIPVPGGRITMVIMLVNLTFMVLFKHNLWKIKKIGVLIVHIGALLLLIGGGLTAIFSSEGNMVIEEGAQSNHVDDYHDMELTIINTSNESLDEYTVFDQPILGKGNILSHENLNFNIEIINYFRNCEPLKRTAPAGIQYKGMLKNFILSELKNEKENNQNRPGITYRITNSRSSNDGIYGIFLGQSVTQTANINNQKYEFIFRRKRTYLPFAIELLDFKKVMHAGTGIAKSYSSEVNLIENGVPRRVLIEMNEPLRHKGYTFFQASFIEGIEGDTTVLAAVKNYGRLFPYISSIIMSIGLLLHLFRSMPKLLQKNTRDSS